MIAHSGEADDRRVLPLPSGGPTVLRILLGAQLRRFRTQKGISREQAGDAIRASHAKISRLELGRVGFKERDLADLLTLYGVIDPDDRAVLLSLGDRANTPGWWHKYGDVLPDWFKVYVGLEEAASTIRTYELQFVPGLLQSPEYARAVILLGHRAASPEEIEHRIALRSVRQERLFLPDAPKLWVVVDEAVLRRPLGGREVMRDQIEHLLDVTERANITLQVFPFDHGGHAAAGGPFTILRFNEQDLPDVVYMEQLTSALYLDKVEETDHYMRVMDRVCMEAMSASATRRFLSAVRKEYAG
jgi:transcriptional regulator with XRE-family HTH domain